MPEFLIRLAHKEVDPDTTRQIQILPLGLHKDGMGRPFKVDLESIETVIRNFEKRENDLVIDYEHQTLDGVVAPAAGWIKELINAGSDGLWAVVEWTERAKEFIKNREYRYLSPVLFVNENDGLGIPKRLHSAALTNDPAIDGMVPLAAKNNPPSQEDNMEFLKKMAEMFGLKGDSTEEQVMEAVAACKTKAEENKETKVEVVPGVVAKALDLGDGATASECEATILALKQTGGNETLQELQKMKSDLAGMKAEKLVAKAMEDGKITAANKEWAEDYAKRDPEGFETFASKAPSVVPMEESPAPAKDKNEKADSETLAIASMMGNSEEDLVKFGGVGAAA